MHTLFLVKREKKFKATKYIMNGTIQFHYYRYSSVCHQGVTSNDESSFDECSQRRFILRFPNNVEFDKIFCHPEHDQPTDGVCFPVKSVTGRLHQCC